MIQTLKKLFETLQEVGLNTNEATVYISLLTIGSNPVSTIAKQSGLNRSGCYSVLARLMNKGFVQEELLKNLSYFTAVEPKYVIRQLKHKQYQLEEKIENLNGTLPQLEMIKKENVRKPRVSFYEGEAGVRNIMEDTLTSSEPLRAYTSLKALETMKPDYFQDYYRRRTRKGIFVKAIYPADELTYYHKKRDPLELRESRLIPKEFDIHIDVIIYDNRVAFTSHYKKFGILIESREMAEAQKKIFDLFWESSKQYDEIITIRLKEEIEHQKTPSYAEGFLNPS